MGSSPGRTNLEIVRDTLAAWETRDPNRILTSFADDVVYHDMPLEPHPGKQRFAKRVATFMGLVTECKIRFHNAVETPSGDVLLEHTDSFRINGKWFVIRVMSSVTLRNGEIVEWREYWDSKTFERQMTEILGVPFKVEDVEQA